MSIFATRPNMRPYLPRRILSKQGVWKPFWVAPHISHSRIDRGFPIPRDRGHPILEYNRHSAIVELIGLIVVRTSILIRSFDINDVHLSWIFVKLVVFGLHIIGDPFGE